MTNPATPEAVVGLELDGKGLAQANTELNKHAQGWEKIEGHLGRVSGHVDSMFGRIAGVAGVAGLGSLIADFVRLDDVASRAALSVGQATGRQGFDPYRNAIRSAAIATSTDPAALGSALVGMQTRVGGKFLTSPGRWNETGQALGNFSRAYGVDLGTLGSSVSGMQLAQKVGPGSTRELLATIAAQAAKTGMEGQTSQYLQAVAAATAMMSSSHPAGTQMGASRTLGALYGAAASVNPAFKDPSLFAAGVAGLDQGVTGAYANPRLQASMQMAGVGYWDQRAGLGGKNGAKTASKVLAWSEKQYGKGSIEQDLYLRSNFGDVSADMLKAFGDGKITYDELLKKTNQGASEARTKQRSKSDQESAGAGIQRKRNQLGGAADGIFNKLFDALDGLSATDLLAIGVGGKVGASVLGKLGSKAIGSLKGNAAKKAVGAAAGDAASAVEHAAGGAAASAAEKGLLKRVGGVALRGVGGPEGLILQGLIEAVLHNNHNYAAEPGGIPGRTKKLTKDGRIPGPGVGAPPLTHHAQAQHGAVHGGAFGGKLFDQLSHAASGVHDAADSDAEKFRKSVGSFDKAVKQLLERGLGGRKAASYTGPAGGGNAAGLAGGNDVAGAGMIMARYALGGGGGGGGGGGAGQSLAAYYGGSPAGAAPTGGGWKDCTLTWYDPALGGTNSSNGAKNPHSKMANGQPYSATAMTCAAPASYAFGTKIQFAYGGKTVTCTVTDRGGAINGAHFDLSRGAANALGSLNAGSVSAKFKVLSSGSSTNPNAKAASAGGGGGGGSTAHAAVASALAWQAGGGASVGGSGGGGAASTPAVHVHVDGREVARQARLVRG